MFSAAEFWSLNGSPTKSRFNSSTNRFGFRGARDASTQHFNILDNPMIELFTTSGEALLFAGVLALMLFVAVALGM